jgi:hypothetical protein
MLRKIGTEGQRHKEKIKESAERLGINRERKAVLC